MALRASLVPDRISESTSRPHPLGVQLRDPWPRRSAHYPARDAVAPRFSEFRLGKVCRTHRPLGVAYSGCREPANELLLPRRLERARPACRPDRRDRGHWRDAEVDQRAGTDHPAPAEPAHTSHDDRLALRQPVATPPDEVGGLAQRARSLVGDRQPSVVESERLRSTAEVGDPGPVELRLGGQAQQAIHSLVAQSVKVSFEVAIAIPPPGTDRQPEAAGPEVRGLDPVDPQYEIVLNGGSDLVGERARGNQG